MVKGSNRKMFRKPGMARRAIGILASSPELAQAANRNMPVRLRSGGSPRLEQINQTIQSIFGPNVRGPEQFTSAGAFDTRVRQAAGQDFLRRNPVTPIDTQPFALNTDLPDQKSFFDMQDSELKQRQTELVAQLKELENRPGGKRKDLLTRQSIQEELDQISEARNQVGIMSVSKDTAIPESGIGEIPLGINPDDFEVPPVSDPSIQAGKDFAERQLTGREVQEAKEAELRAVFGDSLAGPEEFFNLKNVTNLLGGEDAPKTNPIRRLLSPKSTSLVEKRLANREKALIEALASGGPRVAGARAEYERALKDLEFARAGVDAYDEGTKILEARRISKQRDQIQSVLDNPDLPADLRTKLEADLAKIPDPDQASTDLTTEDKDAKPPPDNSGKDDNLAGDGDGDGEASQSQASLVGGGVEVGMKDAAAMSTVKEILADLGQPPELAEQPDIWHYITLAGLGIASGRSDDPLSNIADGVLVAFNQKTKDNKDFADNKYTRYLNDANLKIKEFELGLTAEQVAQGRIKAEADAEKNRAIAKAYDSKDSKEARQEALVKYFQKEGLEFDDAVALAEATITGGTDLSISRNTLGVQAVKGLIAAGDIPIPEGKKSRLINMPGFGTFEITKTSDTTADVKPFSGVYKPPSKSTG